jgi:hypothetical protein
MKKIFTLTAIFALALPTYVASAKTINQDEIVRESCFTMAREWVIQTEGEINLDNVGYVNDLTSYLRTTGVCD